MLELKTNKLFVTKYWISIKNATAVVNLCSGKLRQTILDDTILGYRKFTIKSGQRSKRQVSVFTSRTHPKVGGGGKYLGRTVNNANLDNA